jgi:Fur family transcriptional regulator, ferric uptake regulator
MIIVIVYRRGENVKGGSKTSAPQASLARSQATVLYWLQHQSQAVSAQEIYAHLRQQGTALGLATIYRALEALKRYGLIQSRNTAQGEALYSPIQEDCHYLTCLQCGHSIPLEICPVQDIAGYLQQTQSFKIYYHTLEFFGLCNPCQAKA